MRELTGLTGLILSHIYQILDRRGKGEMTGRGKKREEASWGEGGGERNPELREREKY